MTSNLKKTKQKNPAALLISKVKPGRNQLVHMHTCKAFFLDWIIQIQWTESFRLTHRLVHVILTAWWNPSKQHSNVHVVRKSTLHLPMLWSSDTWFYCIILNKKSSIYLILYSTYESIWTHEWFEKYRLEPAYKKTPNSLIITLHLFETSSVSCINSV